MTSDSSDSCVRPRALGLCSGGLDSILSALVLREQNIHVEWITFETPFFDAEKAIKAAKQNKIELHIRDITPEYLEMLKAPPAGYGKNMNPCMDCHALMFRKAGEFMQDHGFDFLFSGEVMGQRPMSQNGNSLRYVAKHSGFADKILRPLSAGKLPETAMEQSGMVDRQRLLKLSGRSRKPQIMLAAQYGVKDYPSPAGGCLLTDKNYSTRLRDLLDHESQQRINELHLLKHGRHMRLDPQTKIIIGRTKQDNEHMSRYFDPQTDMALKVQNHPGPMVIMPGGGSKEMLFLAASICAGYCKVSETSTVCVKISGPEKDESISVLPVLPKEAKRFMIS
ncbi:MAG: tRNA 4-thiouridine(8) synthase ThiI [Desulfobacteraceae bacterium]|nr:tRNA 4-thiouridine(8) synthase ThiI [Desulfobacteraceae bacterium]